MTGWWLLLSCAGDPDTPEPTSSPTTETPTVIDADGDGHPAGEDCDDLDNTVFPGAPERCDGADQDCDGEIDEGFDLDGDGWRTGLDAGCAALGPTDCDDTDPEIRPNAPERCNGMDDDCDGQPEPTTDADGDGVPVCEDCDDTDDGVSPLAAELCNGRDDDCDGFSDEGFDADGDGVGACLDCDDADPTVHPGAVEVCDRKDNDCDTEWDEGFDTDGDGFLSCRGDCDDTRADVHPGAAEQCDGADGDCNGTVDDLPDGDRDGFLACDPTAPDCDDTRGWVHPGAAEQCDGLDGDCDGTIPADEVDGDGDGDAICSGDCDDADPDRSSRQPERCDGVDNDCDPSTNEVVDGDGDRRSVCQGDCDDTVRSVFPGAPERCNAVDDDCDGDVDDDGACAPCEVSERDGHVYQFCPTEVDWVTARDRCRDDRYELVTIDDGSENNWVSDTARDLRATTWWNGYTDRPSEGDFEWVSGETSTYTYWAVGEPNDNGGQDCVVMRFSGRQWGTVACDRADPYVCEAPVE